ncbi:MAG: VCBS repeat-containing protein [Flavobacteriales bacterium]|nr:VCBS repeat-containing protein [Flavobacteriales bacterium]
MKKIYLMLLVALPAMSFAQSFTNSTNLLPDDYNSGGCLGVVDMNQDGYDDIIILHTSNQLNIVYQDAMGDFSGTNYGYVSNNSQWGMAVADIDNDGHNDVFCGGAYDGVHFWNIDGPGNYYDVDLAEGSIFMQGCSLGDINNDGWLDAFACHDDGESHIWSNDGAGALVPANDWIDMASNPPSDNSGNYGSVFTDFDHDGDLDLFIAKCRQFVSDPYDPRRINTLWVNDGENNYTDQALERGLVLYEQSWTSDFADIDNDGDFDCLITNHSTTLKLMENNGMGYFTDITAGSGLEINEFFLQAKFADFDNDGFVDLIYAGGGEGYLHNNGDQTFTLVDNVFPYSGDEMHSFSIGDLNHDGHLDVYASYGDGYVSADMAHDDALWLNNGDDDNNWISFQLEGVVSNKNAVGAKVMIYGDFGTQIREVRAGESYGINNTFSCHFGLGSATVDYAVVEWPSGIMTLIDNPDENMFHSVIEADCTGPVATVSASGSTTLCEGETVEISLDDTSLNAVWLNGETATTLTVSETGMYQAIVWDESGCPAYTNAIFVEYYVPVQPTISVQGDVEFCAGSSVQLLASDGVSFEWSNGEETQVITVTEAGTYSVAVQGECDTPLTSEEIQVTVWDTPEAPVVSDVTLDVAGSAEFNGTSDNLRWYDSETAETPLAEGATFTTPWIDVTTSFWVEDVYATGGEMANGGLEVNTANGQYHFSSGYYLLFDADVDMIIENVRVFANGAMDRGFAVVDQFGSEIAAGTFAVPDGESVVELNFFVPAGMGYGLRSTDDDPQLWRDQSDVDLAYPYALGDLGAIVNTSVAGDNSNNYYYFFYDWNVATPINECPSDRVEVQAIILGVNEIEELASLEIYPNPAADQVTVALEMIQSARVQIDLIDQLGRTVQSEDLATLGTGLNNHVINLQSVEAGIYNLRMVVNGKTVTQKLIVQ